MKKLLLLIVCQMFFIQINAQKSLVWTKVSQESLTASEKLKRDSYPSEYGIYALDFSALKSQLTQAPLLDSFTGQSNVIIQFPTPDGKLMNYRVYESSVMHPSLAARYQDIKTYIGKCIEDPTATMNISTTIFGLHTMTLSGISGTTYIDPYTKDLNNYIVYSKSKLSTNKTFSCNVIDGSGYIDGLLINSPTDRLARATDSKYRTYRLAMACTIEYAAFHVNAAGLNAGTVAQRKAAVLAAMVVTVNRVNMVYQRDMSLTMQLVANNDLLVNVDSDNFTDNDANLLINESQTEIDAIIGDANYDIGHTVSTGGGGLAQRPSVCVSGKARGITGSDSPVGDAYDIDYVAHEMGHQFGANHTFAGNQGSCGGGNRNAGTAVEPGSGTTIMAYAGICSPQDVQQHSDDHFHAVSLAEMFSHITGAGNCVTGVLNGNNTPVIPALTNYTIPNGTAFKLTAAGVTDTDGDVLTYCWEQNNASTTSAVPSATSTTGVNFRSYSPSTSPTRYFPKFSDVLLGSLSSTYEKIPTVARSMAFRCTVRDNRTPNGGQTKSADMTLTFASGTPFSVTSQNTAGITWNQGSSQTITWNVGGAAVPATTAVNILLSTDGGVTFSTVLASATPNDGTETIIVPNIAAPFCRILIEPTNNIYYAVNSQVFAIGYVVVNTCNTYTYSTATPFVDQAPGSYTTATLNVPITGTISDINVSMKLTHTYLSDVQTDISSPTNPSTFVKLLNRSCGATNGILNLKFSDGASAINCTGGATLQTVAPGEALSAFNGQSPTGDWTFRVYDNYSGDTGTINNWAVEVCTQTITLENKDFELANFALFPNPNNGDFTVKFNSDSSSDIAILVHDMQGRLILDKRYSNTGLFSQNIHLENVQAGVYLVTVNDRDKKVVKRIEIK